MYVVVVVMYVHCFIVFVTSKEFMSSSFCIYFISKKPL